MLKPDQQPEEPEGEEAPQHLGPSFADLIMLVFSGPMRLDDADEEANEVEDEAECAAEENATGREVQLERWLC